MTDGYQSLEQGKGLPLVLLHGLMGETDNWTGIFPYLPINCRTIVLHLPFFEKGMELNSIPAIQQYVRGYLDHAGIERAVLGGNSLGGHVALRLAMEMPQRLAGLVLTGSSGLFERELGNHRGANPSRQWYHDKMCEIFYDDALVTDELVDMVCEVLESRHCRRVLISIAKSAKRDNLADRLEEVRCPSLLIWGKQDKITPPEVAREFCSLLASCKLSWVNRCGHAPMMERPEAFAKLLGRWWKKRICIPDKLKVAV